MPEKFLPEDYGDFSLLKWLSAYIGYSLKPNPPIWSIYVEIVASILIPVWIVASQKRMHAILIFLILLVFGCLHLDFQHHWNFYMVNFYLGLTILLWGPVVAKSFKGLTPQVFWPLIVILFLSFYLPRVLFRYEYGEYWYNLIELMPIALLIALASYMPEKFKWLEKKIFIFFGDISFSLYLIHSLPLIITYNFLLMTIPESHQSMWLMGALTSMIIIPISIVAARWSYKNIELRFVGYGKNYQNMVQKFEKIE